MQLKTYTYPDQMIKDIGHTPDEALRLDEHTPVNSLDEADIIIVPVPLYKFGSREDMMKLPYFRDYENKHVIFGCSDNTPAFDTMAILLQCNLKDWMLARDVNSIACAWPVGKDDIDACAPIPAEGFTFDVGFHGWYYSKWRKAAVDSVSEQFGPGSFDSALYKDFSGYLEAGGTEWNRRRGLFLESLKMCRVQLCPQSISGDWPYRAYEAMCAARVPVLVCTGDVRPRNDEIDYAEFMLTIPAERADEAGVIIREFLYNHSDEELFEMGKKGREAYLNYLDAREWPRFFREMLQKHLGHETT